MSRCTFLHLCKPCPTPCADHLVLGMTKVLCSWPTKPHYCQFFTFIILSKSAILTCSSCCRRGACIFTSQYCGAVCPALLSDNWTWTLSGVSTERVSCGQWAARVGPPSKHFSCCSASGNAGGEHPKVRRILEVSTRWISQQLICDWSVDIQWSTQKRFRFGFQSPSVLWCKIYQYSCHIYQYQTWPTVKMLMACSKPLHLAGPVPDRSCLSLLSVANIPTYTDSFAVLDFRTWFLGHWSRKIQNVQHLDIAVGYEQLLVQHQIWHHFYMFQQDPCATQGMM